VFPKLRRSLRLAFQSYSFSEIRKAAEGKHFTTYLKHERIVIKRQLLRCAGFGDAVISERFYVHSY
jgi:hypothetical protein